MHPSTPQSSLSGVIGLVALVGIGLFCCKLGSGPSTKTTSSSPVRPADCASINHKVYDTELPLSDGDKKRAIDCKVQEITGERRVTANDTLHRSRAAPTSSSSSESKTPDSSSAIIDGHSVERSSPRTQEDWDKLLREAKKRDAKFRTK